MKKLIYFLVTLLITPISLSAQVPSAWTSKGIGGGGALFSPSVNPANHNEIFMSCDMSEIFHTTDMGAGWSELSFMQLTGGHDACMQFTSDPNMRYVVEYPSVDGSDYIRPMKTTDGGTTWSMLSGNPYPLTPNGNILRLFADYANPGHLILADYGTIYYSGDGGSSFHKIHDMISSGAGNHIAGVFFDGANIYIGTNDGLLVSNNGGQTFSTLALTGIPVNEYMLSFAGAKQNGTMRFYCLTAANVWAGYQYGSDYWNAMKGIYHMDNASGSWTSNISGITIGVDFPVFIGMASNNIETVYISGGSTSGNPIVMKSVSGGPWTHVFLAVNNQNIYTGWCGYLGDHGWGYAEAPFGFTVAYDDANTVMFTDYSDSHITTDGGVTWRQQYVSVNDENPMNAATPKGKKYHGIGMENTSCWQILWNDSLNMMAAYSDINGIMSDDKGESWKFLPGLTQNTVYRIVKNTDGRIYASTSNIHDIFQSTRIYDAQIDAGTGAVYVSTDNGSTFSMLHNFGHPVIWIAPDPTNPNRMYASVLHSNKGAIGGIWVTNNLDAGASATWTKMPNPPRSNGHPYNINVLNNGDLVASYSARKPTSGSVFTDSSGVYYYDSFASAWYDRSDPNMRFWTQDVVVDPNDPSQGTWYGCVFTGWGTPGISGTGGLFKTTDKGITWNRINDNFRVNSCTVNPSNHNELYVTTEIDGLWFCSNAASGNPAFTRVTSFSFRHPMRMFYNPYKSSELWVSSFGNGIKTSRGAGPSGIITPRSQSRAGGSVFPNPAGKIVTVSIDPFTSAKEYSWILTDMTGREAGRGYLDRETRIDLQRNGICAGTYMITVYEGTKILMSRKLIVD
jgi:photosystem II stability/assembly factor-like uncharacterized protein